MAERHSEIAAFLSDNVTKPIEGAFLKVGINSAWKAGIVVGLATAGILYATKPAIAFDSKTGEPRPWIFFYDAERTSRVEPTYLPFWLGATLVGFGFSLVI